MRAPARSGYTVSVELVRAFIDCAARCGLARARLEDPELAASGARRLSGDYMISLWERITRISGDPAIGFRMARRAEPRMWGVLGQTLPRCRTVMEAFRQVERYNTLSYQGLDVELAASAKTLTLVISHDLPAGLAGAGPLLWALTNLALMPQGLTGRRERPILIDCTLPRPPADAVADMCSQLPFRFGRRSNRITFHRRVGDLPIPTADPDLKGMLERVLEQDLAELGPAGNFERSVAVVLRGMLNGDTPTLEGLSRRSGMSTRTLQRRLAEAGLTFQGLLRDVRREMSDELLARSDYSQSDIAFLLGYSEVSAFSHAYRSWTGRPPGAARV